MECQMPIRSGAILLKSRRAQALGAVLVVQLGPSIQFFFRQGVAVARFLAGKKTPPDSRDDFCLAASHPATDARGWEVIPGHWLAVWALNAQSSRILLRHEIHHY